MTKPLCFILQLIGLGLFLACFTGLATNPTADNMGGFFIGIILILIGGFGIRKRIKK